MAAAPAAAQAAALTAVAGLSTALGAFALLFARADAQRRLAQMLSVSAGVMLHLSYCDLLADAGATAGPHAAAAAFLAGAVAFHCLHLVLPDDDGGGGPPVAVRRRTRRTAAAAASADAEDGRRRRAAALRRLSLLTAVGISLHNIPEGIAVYMASLRDWSLALPMVVAIAAHNVPEGAAVALPVFYATGSRWEGFKWALVSGLCEPLGAVLIGWPLSWYLTEFGVALALAAVAGVMVAMVVQELLPAALRDLPKEAVARLVLGGAAGIAAMAAVHDWLAPGDVH